LRWILKSSTGKKLKNRFLCKTRIFGNTFLRTCQKAIFGHALAGNIFKEGMNDETLDKNKYFSDSGSLVLLRNLAVQTGADD